MKIDVYIKTNARGWNYQEADIISVVAATVNGEPKSKGYRLHTDGTFHAIYMSGIINALKNIKNTERHTVTIHMENEYVGQIINSGQLSAWNNRAWLRRDGAELANKRLWQQIYNYQRQYDILCEPYDYRYDESMSRELKKMGERRNGKHSDGV